MQNANFSVPKVAAQSQSQSQAICEPVRPHTQEGATNYTALPGLLLTSNVLYCTALHCIVLLLQYSAMYSCSVSHYNVSL